MSTYLHNAITWKLADYGRATLLRSPRLAPLSSSTISVEPQALAAVGRQTLAAFEPQALAPVGSGIQVSNRIDVASKVYRVVCLSYGASSAQSLRDRRLKVELGCDNESILRQTAASARGSNATKDALRKVKTWVMLAPEVDKQSSCALLACGRSMAAGKSSAGASPSRRHKRTCRVGISLLEVVLALAILGVASAYLAQSMQLAAQNAIRAQRLTQAELVMESVMNQVIAGVIPAQSITWTPYTTTSANGNWNYMINVVQAEMQGMIGIQVAVQESRATDATDSMMPDLMATRWIIDPSLQLDVPPEQTTDSGTGTGGTGQSSSGQGGGSAAGSGGVQ